MPRRRPPSPLPPELAAALQGASPQDVQQLVGHLLSRGRRPTQPVRRRRARSDAAYGLVVRVELVDLAPTVWRRLALPSTLHLDQLHGVLQAVFAWEDSHLHRFSLDDDPWGDGERFLCPFDVEEGEDDEVGVPACDVRLDEVLREVGDRLTYLYDYGDSWEHRLVVEQVGPPVPQPQLLDGEHAAPPEDSRGSADDDEPPPPLDLQAAHAALERWQSSSRVPPAVASLLQHLSGTPQGADLRQLVLDAAGAPEPDAALRATATAPLRRLLNQVGDGVALTAAGWLPPDLVTAVMAEVFADSGWIGKGNREDMTTPVRVLREVAQRVGLLRKAKGRLLPSRLGRALVEDPDALFAHLGDRLRLLAADQRGGTFGRTAGELALLGVAAGRLDLHRAAATLTAGGWSRRGGGPVTSDAVRAAVADLLEVLGVAGGSDGRAGLHHARPSAAQRALARAALTR